MLVRVLFHLKSNEELEKCDIELLEPDEADKEPVKIVKDMEYYEELVRLRFCKNEGKRHNFFQMHFNPFPVLTEHNEQRLQYLFGDFNC